LTKNSKGLYDENYKALKKEITEENELEVKNGMISCVHGLAELN
jgi:hypothetical protein